MFLSFFFPVEGCSGVGNETPRKGFLRKFSENVGFNFLG